MKLKLLTALFIFIAIISGLKIYLDYDTEKIAKTLAYNYALYNPQATKFNLYFSELVSIAMVTAPYSFSNGNLYKQAEVDANFEVIINALKKQKESK